MKLESICVALFALFIAIANVNAEILSEPFYPNDNERTIKWTFDTETGVLTLSGAGATPNYTQEAPFGHEKGFKVKKLVVEEGVTIINNYFLYGASSLQEITISSSVFFAIWDYVFSNCTALTTVKIDKSKNENGIGFLKEAFAGCTALTNIEIAEAQEYVNFGEKSFSGCTALKTLKLNEPKKGISFDGESFAGCTSLTDIHFPVNGLLAINATAFYNCHALKNLHIKDLDDWKETYFTNIVNNLDRTCIGFCKMISAEYDRDKGTTVKTFGEPCDIILNGEKVTKVELHNSLFGDSYNYQVAFAGTSIESMEVKGGCTSLNDFAFYGCTKLKSVDLCNNGLLDIGVATFEYCSNLTDIKIGRGCRFLPGYGSSYSATAPTYAFSSCESLKNIVLEDGLTILQDCFGPLHRKSNTNGEALELESLTIPGSLQEILPNINYKKAFYGSEKDWYASGVGSVEDSNIYVDNKLWQAPTGAVVVPEGTAAIRNGKFSKDATSIKIPDSVTEIDSMALARTAWFNSQPDGLVYNENWLVGYKGESPLAGNIEIKEGTTRYANIFNANENIRSIKFPEGIKDIIDYSFSGCSRLKSVHIPNSVERIGSYAFSDCILNSVEIPNSVKRIEAFAFNTHKDSLKSITIRKKSPEAFEFTSEDIFNRTICNNAILLVPTGSREAYATNEFWGQFRIIAEINNNTIEGVCSESIKWELDTETKTLTLSGEGELHDAPWHNLAEHINNVVVDDKIEIPNKDYFFGTSWYNNQPEGLLYIGSSLMGFKGVDSTTTVIDIKDGTRFIADEAFKNNSIIKKVNSPNSLKRIGEKAFYKCSALTSIAIDDVEIIGENAFTTCSNLQGELNLKNLTSLGEAAFDNCKSLEKITSLGYITNIPNRSFHGATNLKECNIPNTVKVIDKEAFYKTSLKKIIIPNSVDTIGLSAFTGAALDTIIIASNEVAILNQAFRDCDSIKAVYILSDSVPVKGWTSITMRPFYTGRKANPRGTLYVPLGCKEKYPEDITMDFVEVVEMDMTELRNKTGIDAPVSTTIEKRIIASDGKLIVSNTKAGEVVSLYSVTGSLLINTIAEGNNTEINISGISGINIVRIGSKAYKVSL